MVKTPSFKRLILRAVLRQVSPMVIRLVSVSDQMRPREFHDVFRTILGWNGDLGYIVRVHGQEINSFRRKTRLKALHKRRSQSARRLDPRLFGALPTLWTASLYALSTDSSDRCW
jgi:hypothetical protein